MGFVESISLSTRQLRHPQLPIDGRHSGELNTARGPVSGSAIFLRGLAMPLLTYACDFCLGPERCGEDKNPVLIHDLDLAR